MFRFESLEIWHLAIKFVKLIYEHTSKFPKDELFGLVSQLRRAVVSISSNIAEGSLSGSKKEFKNFLNYSIRSIGEVVSELVVSKERNYLNEKDFSVLYNKAETIAKRITAFKNSL